MKTIKVNTTSYKNPQQEVNNGNANIENWFVGNGLFGVEASKYNDYDDSIKVIVYVSTMFPGTFEEWDRHIKSCIEDYVIETEKTFINAWGDKSLI
jgi:hypothetical protein